MLQLRRIVMVRHGETEGESSIRFFGRTDVPLSALGREQARRLAGLVQHVGFSAVVHSPLARARESAEIVTALLDQPPDRRMEGTAATVALSIAGGADMVRVHDVKEMIQVCRMSDAVIRGWRPEGWRR